MHVYLSQAEYLVLYAAESQKYSCSLIKRTFASFAVVFCPPQVEMDFKAECTAGDQIECYGMPLTDCANGNGSAQQFLHLLRKGGTDVEVWRARTTWTPRTAGMSPAAAAAVSSTACTSSSNGKVVPPCAGASQNGSKPAGSHLNGNSAVSSSSSKSTASCSRTECSNTNCSNNHTDTAAAESTAAPAQAADPAEAAQVASTQGAEQSQVQDKVKKGWFGLW